MTFCSQSRAFRRAYTIVAAGFLGVTSLFTAVAAPLDSSGLELQVVANSDRIRVWDCLLLKYVIRNTSGQPVVPTYFTEYQFGKVAVEVKREQETAWREFHSRLAGSWKEASRLGPGPAVAPGASHAELAELFMDEKDQPIFAAPGVYLVRVTIPFEGRGVVRSESVRVVVSGIPADERRLIEHDPQTFVSTAFAGLILKGDLDRMSKLEGQLSRCENRSLLRCQIQILEQLRKSGYRLDDDGKRLFARLRQEHGDILLDYITFSQVTKLCNDRQWEAAIGLLSTVPGISAGKERLMRIIQDQGR